ncbi:two component transcriptional regulator, LytTR family [Spirosomataceae bacterium TFI 002]|nr:two component transcriptional regulator, LytTR family [Spirosomataceae bacterium TFI 002]
MKKLKTILVDDEELAINRLERLLKEFNIIEIIGTASDGVAAVKIINELQPDLVFLDIQMPGLNGFEVLNLLTSPKPKVVFATAYDHYAIKAFEENSLDYLLKPIEKERLAKTIAKLESDEVSLPTQELLASLLNQLEPKKEIHSINVKHGDKIIFVSLKDISHFQASGKYVVLHTLDGEQYLTNYTITSIGEKLETSRFTQISRSCIVNVRQMKELEKFYNGKYKITMNDSKKTLLESGTSFGDNLKELMEF